jgi:hypothetical protein
MHYPEFFTSIEGITLKDELSEVLGAFEEGLITYSYLDVVKNAGHSCPTMAGAYLMVREGLRALYGKEIPKRGEVKVFFKDDIKTGTTGVVANAFSLITGATNEWGFKGLGGKYARRDLMFFNADIPLHVRMTRIDNLKTIDIAYDPSIVLPDAQMQPLMQKVLSGVANQEEKQKFGLLWQTRVRKILEKFDKVIDLK